MEGTTWYVSKECVGVTQATTNSVLQIIPDSGHSMGEVSIAEALVEASDKLNF